MELHLVVLPVHVGLVGEGGGQSQGEGEHEEPEESVGRHSLGVQDVAQAVQAGL